jgi:hypothetical protein
MAIGASAVSPSVAEPGATASPPSGDARMNGWRREWPALVAATLVAAPTLIAAYPPMTDFPHHEALVALLHNFDDRSLWPPGLYAHNFGQPNQLMHLLAWPLSYLLPITLACKIVTAGAAAAVVLGASRLARYLGASPFLAFAFVPFSLGWLSNWGLINNLMGLGILFAVLPGVDRFAARPDLRRGVRVIGVALLLYFAHELMLFVYLGALVLFSASRPLRPWRPALARVTPLPLVSALILGQLRYQRPFLGPNDLARPTIFDTQWTKLELLPRNVAGMSDPLPRDAVCGLLLLLLIALLEARAKAGAVGRAPYDDAAADGPGSSGASLARAQGWLLAYRFEVLSAGLMGLYFAVPLSINGAFFVYERFLHPALGVMLIAAGARLATTLRPLAKVLAAASAAAMVFAVWPLYADASRLARDLDELLVMIPKMSAVASIECEGSMRWRPFLATGQLSRVLTTRGGRVFFSFTESAVAPVVLTAEHRWGEVSVRMHDDQRRFVPSHDFKLFSYVLVHASLPGIQPYLDAALAPEGRFVARVGEWALYRSTLDVIPIMSQAPAPPEPLPPTFRERLLAALHPTRREPEAPAP